MSLVKAAELLTCVSLTEKTTFADLDYRSEHSSIIVGKYNFLRGSVSSNEFFSKSEP